MFATESTYVLECSGPGPTFTLSAPSSAPLQQVHERVSDLLGRPREGEHRFVSEEKGVEYCDLRNITCFDGFITQLADGVYLRHPHPHTLEDNTVMTQVRAEHLFSVDLALSEAAPLMYLRDECCYTISLARTRPSTKASLPAKYSGASLSADKQLLLDATLQLYAANLAQSIHTESVRFHADPHAACEWLEITGESCCYCTPGFL